MKEILLSQGKIALVDDEDYEMLNVGKWSASQGKGLCYAVRAINGRMVKMHRLILNAPDELDVDHRDGNGLNNQRSNIRLATTSQNLANKRSKPHTSRYKGVHWDSNRKKWFTQVSAYGKHYALGRFSNEEDAARAYDAKLLEFFGEFARTNFSPGGPPTVEAPPYRANTQTKHNGATVIEN